MKNALTCPFLVLLASLDAYASHSQQQPTDSTAAVAAATDASADNDWQTLCANYMACAQRQADSGVSGATQTKDMAASTLDAYEDALHAMHDGFRDHLSASMLLSGARKAADCVTKDTRKKAHVYLMGYVDHTRYLAKSR